MNQSAERSDTDRGPRWQHRLRRRNVRIAIGAFAGVLVLLVATVGVLRLVHRGAVLPGTVVAGVEVGGMDRTEVRDALAQLVADRQDDPIEFVHEDEIFTYVPGETSYDADLDAAVDAAMDHGRDGGVLRDSWTHASTLWGTTHRIELPDTTHREPVRDWVDELAAELDRPPFPGEVAVDPSTLDIEVTPASPGLEVLRDETVAATLEGIRRAGPVRADLPVEVLPQQVSDEDVQRVADQAERAVAEPLDLHVQDSTITLEPGEIARLIGSRAVRTDDGERTLRLHVGTAAAREVLAPHADELDHDPRDARFDVGDPPGRLDALGGATWTPLEADVDVVPSQDGGRLDAVLAAPVLERLLAAGDREGELTMRSVRPELTTEDAEDLGITHLIGTFTTYYQAGQSRVTNIQRMADIVDGALLLPGETFSLNGHVGRRTVEKGFVGGGTIVRGEFVDEIGGGVSQFATTTYNAAFFAGLAIPEYQAHSYYISRYPMGREATVYYPQVDLRVRNTTSNGLLVRTSHTPTSVTVSFYGDNGDATVRAQHGDPYNHQTADDIVRRNDDLPPGARHEIQGSGTGFDVVVHRHITRDGETESERFFTRYRAQPRIVEEGPPRPEPEPSPTPDPDDDDEDDDDDPGQGSGNGNGGGGGSGGGDDD